jgi:4-amino-4-deoxy-L-arabinose transferase-like glycosyltransferase
MAALVIKVMRAIRLQTRRWWIALFLLGAVIRLEGVLHPLDAPNWRECDVAGIARNFYREGINPLFPRIDWRGNGPGYAEMEFPTLSWLMGMTYPLVGVNEQVGRWIVFAFSLVSLTAMFAIARYVLQAWGAIAAGVFFAVSPLVLMVSTSLQPDGLMLAGMLAGLYGFMRWIDSDEWPWYVLSLLATAFAILAKAPAAHIGLVYAVLLLSKKGLSALRQPMTWAFALLAIGPGALWYVHAHRFWIEYGNSLGLSNESHWVGLDVLTESSFIVGISRIEYEHVWTFGGLMVAAIGLLAPGRDAARRLAVTWLSVVAVYYLIAARTACDEWATYYHVVAVPPAAIAFGRGVQCLVLWSRECLPRRTTMAIVCAGLSFLVAIATQWPLVFVAGMVGAGLFVRLGRSTVLEHTRAQTFDAWQSFVVGLGVVAAVAAPLALLGDAWRTHPPHESHPYYVAAQNISRRLPEGGLILASGGPKYDPMGLPVAYNASYFFYWLDRKGFNIPIEDQSLMTINELAKKGARVFVAERVQLDKAKGLEGTLRARAPVVYEDRNVLVFDLLSVNTQ